MATSRLEWARLLERLCYLFPPVIGVGLIGILQETEPGVPGLERGLVLVGSFGYTLLTLGVALAIYADARRIRRQPRAGGSWTPRPWLNALLALAWAPAAGPIYLARRHRRFGTPPGWPGWWFVVAISFATTVFGLAAAVIAIVFDIPDLLTTAVALAGTVAVGLFPVAIHQDAAYVSTYADAWRPNPGGYLAAAFLSLTVPILQPMLAAYYLWRRRRSSI